MPSTSFPRACVALLAALGPFAHAQDAATLPSVTVQGNYLNAIGSSDSASQGVVTSKLIESRPTLRPGEVLEFVPGVIVTQHSGDGKANQYFLRGFNLDHGTDFSTWIDGMPANMVSHAHGQGYSDINWLIPELVDRIAYRKGPYFADEGDFSAAGAAHIRLFDVLPAKLAEFTVGQNGYGRALVAGNAQAAAGNVLYAFEAAHNNGPWVNPERFHRSNAVLRYSTGDDASRWSLTGMAYKAGWNATDQVPQRAVDAGWLDRFGTLDSTDGGGTARYSLSWEWQRKAGDAEWRANAFVVRSRLQLFSNFTYFLQNPSDVYLALPGAPSGDQFAQSERRTLAGGALSRRWPVSFAGRETNVSTGVQLRQDRVDPLGLYETTQRQTTAVVQQSSVRESSVGAWMQADTQWTPWLRSIAGVRADHYDFEVASSISANSGRKGANIVSPKLSLVFGPWAKTEYFVNAGYGFHSNDARGVTEQLSPRELLPAQPVTPLVRARGAELGMRTEVIPQVQSSLSVWHLKLGSELVFSGDAGDTEASRASRREGIEWNNHWRAKPWLQFDADLAWSRARFTQDDPSGNYVPGSVGKVASFGATVTDLGPWFGQFQLRYFGPRPLIEDNSRRSQSTTLAYMRVGYKFTPKAKLALDVFNLFNRRASDIDYWYASRLPGEPLSGVDDVHFHPVEPRSLRATLTLNF